ncbi:MAG: hypothetical protein AB7G18_14720 [Pyrinomonadaceae bacterium]
MPGLTQNQIDVLMREGSFRGLLMMLERGEISESGVSAALTGIFRSLLGEIGEAKKEIVHIQNALAVMEGICRSAMHDRHGKANGLNTSRFTENLITLDAWVVSLVETDLTMTGMLNPGHTRKKIAELASAMNNLMDKRAAMKHPVFDDPNLFRGYVDR